MLTTPAHAGMDFRYADPDKGFKRASVKGVLGRLVELKDSQHATALEVAAGGKLYQVPHIAWSFAAAGLTHQQLVAIRSRCLCMHCPCPCKAIRIGAANACTHLLMHCQGCMQCVAETGSESESCAGCGGYRDDGEGPACQRPAQVARHHHPSQQGALSSAHHKHL